MKHGCSVKGIDGKLELIVGFENFDLHEPIMPDIVNVEQPNDKTVFVQFADGGKEVAKCSEEDTFSFETGVLICLFKKIMEEASLSDDITGSTVYNKLVKYAVSKKDATKKLRNAEREREKEKRREIAEVHRNVRNAENKDREEEIRMIKEAIIQALNERK